MVGVKRKVIDVVADPAPVSAPNSLHSTSIDRRTKAIRSCSNWNSALLHGRRTRGPQWDYATASYHVSKGSAEYYKGVTRIQSDQSNSTTNHNPSSTSNHYPINSSSHFQTNPIKNNSIVSLNPSSTSNHYNLNSPSQFPASNIKINPNATLNPTSASNPFGLNSSSQFQPNLQSRATLNVQLPNQHAHQHSHSFQQDPDQFQNRLRHTPSQHSQSSSHGHPLVNPAQTGAYSVHPAHLQLVSNQVGMNQQGFNNLPNAPDSKSSMFANQGPHIPNSTNTPKVIPSPHFQAGVSPVGPHGIPRHMSTTPSHPSSQPERKGEPHLSHPGSYHNPVLPAPQTIRRSHSSQLGPAPQSFSPAQYYN